MLPEPDLDEIDRQVARLAAAPVVGCWIRGARGEPTFWSHHVFEFFGFPVAEHAPSADRMLQRMDGKDRARLWHAFDACRSGAAQFCQEYTVRTPQGIRRRLKSVAQPARSGSGRTVIVGTVQDITEIEAACTALQTAAQLLRRAPQPAQAGGFSPKQWSRVEALIREPAGKSLSLAEMSARLGMKISEFIRRFRFTTGETPHRYLLQLRLARAGEALRTAEANIAQVALDCGFFDQAHFTRHFKRHYGLTPGRFIATQRAPVRHGE